MISNVMKLVINSKCDADKLDAFVANHRYGSLFQQTKWAKVKDNWGHYFLTGEIEGKIVASAMILSKALPLGLKAFYLPRGPVVDYENDELVKGFMQGLYQFAKREKAVFIKMDPLFVTEEDKGEKELHLVKLLEGLGIVHRGFTMDMYATAQPRTQAIVNIKEPKEKDKKLKYYINRSLNMGIQLVRMKSEGAHIFAELEEKTAKRKGIALRNEEYFKRLMDVYGDDANLSFEYLETNKVLEDLNKQKADIEEKLKNPKYKQGKINELKEQLNSIEARREKLLLAKENNIDPIWVSGGLVIRSGRYSELLYAGMDEDYSIYRSNASFQDAMDWAKEKGCETCNLGGVATTLDDSLANYKRLYQPDFTTYVGEFDYPINKLFYKAYILLYAHKSEY